MRDKINLNEYSIIDKIHRLYFLFMRDKLNLKQYLKNYLFMTFNVYIYS